MSISDALTVTSLRYLRLVRIMIMKIIMTIMMMTYVICNHITNGIGSIHRVQISTS